MTEANNGKEEHHLTLCTFCRVGLKILFLLTAADHFSFLYIITYKAYPKFNLILIQ